MRNISILFYLLLVFNSQSQSSGGILQSNTVVCRGNNNGILSVSSYSGSILRWEHSANANGPWSTMSFQSSSYNFINLGEDTYFRVVVQLSGYAEATSNVVLVSCDHPSAGGVISTTTSNCINTPLTCTLGAYTGSIVNWDYSTNNWITKTTVTSTNPVFTLSNFSVVTSFRARVQNGTCASVLAPIITVTPAPASSTGTVFGTQTVCAGSNSGTITILNQTGMVHAWESASSQNGPFYAISGSQSQNFIAFSNLQQETWFRVKVQNANCPVISSSATPVNVDQPGTAGSVMGTTSVCAGTNSGTLIISGNTAPVIDWDVSVNGGNSFASTNNSSTILQFSNITLTQIYRVKSKNGVCPSVFSPTFQVTVNSLPISSFSVNNVCQKATTIFTNSSSGGISYFWDFGDGFSSSQNSPSHTYNSSGTYSVKLISTSPAGCSNHTSKNVVVFPSPVAAIAGPDTSCFGIPLSFINNSSVSSGTLSNAVFYFGYVSPTIPFNPIGHKFPAHGNYKIRLVISTGNSCKDSIDHSVLIFPKPVTEFVVKNVCFGTPNTFTNTSYLSYGAMSHVWNFGTGLFSNLGNPSYLFPGSGSYNVALISTSDHGCKDTSQKQVITFPTPTLTLFSSNMCLDDSAHFQTSALPTMAIKSHSLIYGDGSYSNDKSHKYQSPGNYTVLYNAITDSGCVNTASLSLVVYPEPIAKFSKQNICFGDSAEFVNQSTLAGGTLNFEWKFLPGTVINEQHPKYFYHLPGTYSVALKVKSTLGCVDSTIQTLSVYARPKADFTFTGACDGIPVELNNSTTISDSSMLMYHWNFGDQTTSNSENPSKQFLNFGDYRVTLIAKSALGCADTAKKIVPVFEGPIADFSAPNNCFGSQITMTNKTILKSGSFTSTWNFGDKKTASQDSPAHVYEQPGTFEVILKVVSDKGCRDSIDRFTTVYSLPKVFAGKDTTVEKGNLCQLHASGAHSFNWYPAELLDNPTAANPSFKVFESSTFIVSGTDERGCENSDTIIVSVKSDFIVIPFNVLTPDDNNMNDTWIVKNIEAYKENHVRIIDQWNREVFATERYANTWDGRDKNGNMLPDGTYYYLLTFKESSKQYSGFITLLRNEK